MMDQTSINIPTVDIDRADRLTRTVSGLHDGRQTTRSDVLRLAIRLGLDAIEGRSREPREVTR